jgi:gamma-D-glutamyl-L-lysine dipeptidyl-peptidase
MSTYDSPGDIRWDHWPTGDSVVSVPVTTVWCEPSAARDVDSPIIQAVPRPERWMSALGIPERLDLLGRVNTQALMGEPVLVVGEHDGWSEVRLPWQPTSQDFRGYPGWIPSAHITPAKQTADPLVVLSTRLCYDAASRQTISVGSALRLIDADSMRTPDGKVIKLTATPRIDPLTLAMTFLGVSYLWGGLSGWGVDCSGLVHVTARAGGIMIDRDSVDQFANAQAGTIPIDPDELRWFAHPATHERAGRIRHVAFALQDNRILHAPRTGFSVEVIDASEQPYASDVVTHRSD